MNKPTSKTISNIKFPEFQSPEMLASERQDRANAVNKPTLDDYRYQDAVEDGRKDIANRITDYVCNPSESTS